MHTHTQKIFINTVALQLSSVIYALVQIVLKMEGILEGEEQLEVRAEWESTQPGVKGRKEGAS